MDSNHAVAATQPTSLMQRRIPADDNRPAWAKPQAAWPFRVIDPQSHRPGSPAQTAPGWRT